MKAFVIDLAMCNGCYACQIGCKDEHCGNDWSPYAKPQPNTGHFWLKLNEFERGAHSQVRVSYVPVLCMHCDDAPCIEACPIDGVISRRNDGLVIIDPKKCSGCMSCIDKCPYGCIYYNESLNIAQKCTGCAHLVDRGWPISVPRCVDNCPNDCIKFGEESDLSSMISQAEILNPEYGLSPRVFYIGLPNKMFVAGTVYDPAEEEVVIDATCTLVGESGTFNASTDEFGDFWFEDLVADDFTLDIEKAGKVTSMEVSTKQGDVGLGDIPLS